MILHFDADLDSAFYECDASVSESEVVEILEVRLMAEGGELTVVPKESLAPDVLAEIHKLAVEERRWQEDVARRAKEGEST